MRRFRGFICLTQCDYSYASLHKNSCVWLQSATTDTAENVSWNISWNIAENENALTLTILHFKSLKIPHSKKKKKCGLWHTLCCLYLTYYFLLDFCMTCFFSPLRSGLCKAPLRVGSHLSSLKKAPVVTLHHTCLLFFPHSSSYNHWWSHLFLGLQI